ncbi:conjugated polyketone reductase C1 [Collybia nuda]|uniref:Conjugated polyketone reductase C1 n=1 Tax=Collybia nuda TaxID=64659 RepID=A0A9P5Y5L4_9AGAR|nr:conjugated polyketone reductase C1 [Collybia nuda]
MSQTIASFNLHDGTTIPWLAWGCGSGQAQRDPVNSGTHVLNAGINHIDTAQIYNTEEATGQIVAASPLGKDKIYVTSKLGAPEDKPISLDSIRGAVAETTRKLGFIPDLFLIHNPFVAHPGELKAMWNTLEDLKVEGKLKSIGVSNFRVQDFEAIFDGARFKPVVNQIEFHPYVLSHLEPVLALQAKHGIVTEAFGPLTPVVRHGTGGPLKPILERIAARLTKSTGKDVDTATVLLLWTRAQGVVAVSASGNADRIRGLAEVAKLPDLLEQGEIDEITRVGKTVHFRHYTEHMEVDFPLPNLPSGL